MIIYTDKNGRIVRLEDPEARTRMNFYGKERLGKLTKTEVELSPRQVADLCKDYYVKKIKNGEIVGMNKSEKAKVLKVRYGPYLGSEGARKKISKKYGMNV